MSQNLNYVEEEEYIWGDRFKEAFEGNGKILYSKIDHVKDLPSAHEGIIVTHNGDIPVNDDKVNHFPNFKKWFGQSVESRNEKVIPIPIGLNNDYIEGSVEKRKNICNKCKENKTASRLLFLNCNISTYPADRQPAYDYFQDKKWCTVKAFTDFQDCHHFWDDIVDHHFSLSPRGAGLECVRTWEILYLNRYPVMKRYYGLEKLYSQFPVVFVDDWAEITEDFLIKELERIKNTVYDLEKFKFSYWKKLIEESV